MNKILFLKSHPAARSQDLDSAVKPQNDSLFMVLYFLLLSIFLSGCAIVEYKEEIAVLQDVGKSQIEIQKYVDMQQKLFYKLVQDMEKGELKHGLLKREIVKKYGEPIISWQGESGDTFNEKFLYRAPTEYFEGDKIYMYFNESGELTYLKHEKGEEF